jgi:putative transposase
LSEALRTADDGMLMRTLLQMVLPALIDAEAAHHIDAGPHERNEHRVTQRNGTRDKSVATTSRDLLVKSPKGPDWVLLPVLLSPRRRIDLALHVRW